MARCVEVCILTADVVRRYARGELPSNLCMEVEEMLLDDDRARRLVRALAPPNAGAELPRLTADNIGAAEDACAALVHICQVLRDKASALTLRQFARLQLLHAEGILADMRRSYSRTPAAASAARSGQSGKTAGLTPWALLARAGRAERMLSNALRAAYRSPSPPFWKARLAAWISRVEIAHCDIAWLDLVFMADRRL